MRSLILISSIVLLTIGCKDEPKQSGLDQVSRYTLFVNDEVVVSETDIEYNPSGKITRLTQTQENFAILTYEAIYEGEEIVQINRTVEQIPAGNINTEIYEVINEGSKIYLTTDDESSEYEFIVSDSYVDTFKIYLDDAGINIYTVAFRRDDDNNIKEISNYVSDQSESNQFIWSFSYTNFLNDVVLHDGINPVYNYAYNLYDGLLGLMLNLKTSRQAPLSCSQKSANGDVQENLIIAFPTVNESQQLEVLDFVFSDLPNNSYQIILEYN